MSNMPTGGPPQQPADQTKQETFLTPEERAQIRRLMGHPTDYPKELGPWIREYLAINPPDINIEQIKGKRGVPRYITRSAEAVAADSTTETTIYTASLSGRSVSPTGQLRVVCFWGVSCADVTNTVTIRVKIGSSTLLTFTISTDVLDGNVRQGCLEAKIVNAGAFNSQLAFGTLLQVSSGTTTDQNALGSSSVDLSQDQDLTITVDWDTAGTQNFDSSYFMVEAFNPVGS